MIIDHLYMSTSSPDCFHLRQALPVCFWSSEDWWLLIVGGLVAWCWESRGACAISDDWDLKNGCGLNKRWLWQNLKNILFVKEKNVTFVAWNSYIQTILCGPITHTHNTHEDIWTHRQPLEPLQGPLMPFLTKQREAGLTSFEFAILQQTLRLFCTQITRLLRMAVCAREKGFFCTHSNKMKLWADAAPRLLVLVIMLESATLMRSDCKCK